MRGSEARCIGGHGGVREEMKKGGWSHGQWSSRGRSRQEAGVSGGEYGRDAVV
jgi:hypothetical protein